MSCRSRPARSDRSSRSPLLTLTILLPFTLRFSLSAAAIMKFFEDEAEGDRVNPAETFREIALQYESMYDSNVVRIRILAAGLPFSLEEGCEERRLGCAVAAPEGA